MRVHPDPGVIQQPVKFRCLLRYFGFRHELSPPKTSEKWKNSGRAVISRSRQ
jgi:hypothetical protein